MKYDKTEALLPSPTFCVLPWVHLYANELGQVYPCCIAMQSGAPISDERGEPYTIHDLGKVEAAWNSEAMRAIRRDMQTGVRPSICTGCWRVEDLGMLSYRRTANRDYHDRLVQIGASLQPDGSAPANFPSVDIRLGNLCNLRCRMCSPVSSKALSGEWRQLYAGTPNLEPMLTKLREVDWYRKPEFWQGLEQLAPTIEVLNFAGGEPLLIREQFDFLARLVELGLAGRIALEYITNGTTLPERAFELWPHFRQVSLLVSLDGYGEVDEFIRHPTRWSTLDANLRRIDAEMPALGLSEVRFNTTVQLYNVLRLDELFDYTLGFERILQLPSINILVQPDVLHIGVLPRELRQLAIERIEAFRGRTEARWPDVGNARKRFAASLDGIVATLREQDHTHLLPAFRTRNDCQDRYRRQQLARVIPELAPLLEPEGASP